jgi:hypothetical protein
MDVKMEGSSGVETMYDVSQLPSSVLFKYVVVVS